MKKRLLIIFIIIVAIIVFFVGKGYFEKMDADKKIDKFITEKAGIPSSEILVVTPIEKWGNIGDSYKQYVKSFTTKKDLEKWKEKLRKEGKNYKDVNIESCETTYSCRYIPRSSKFNQTNKYYFSYVLSGNSVNSFKKIENNFAYPPNEYISKLLKEENPDFYQP